MSKRNRIILGILGLLLGIGLIVYGQIGQRLYADELDDAIAVGTASNITSQTYKQAKKSSSLFYTVGGSIISIGTILAVFVFSL